MKQYQYILTRTKTGATETLTRNPAGWKELGITFMRHEVYHSVLRSFTLSLRFPNIAGGGYDFIYETYKVDGINSEIGIEIKIRNSNTNAYDSLFTGVLDFSPEKFTIERDFIEIAIVDSSVLQKFISRDENEIDLFATKSMDGVTITPPTKYTELLTPVDIITKSEAICNQIFRVENRIINDYKWYLHDPTYSVNQILGVSLAGVRTIYTNESDVTITMSVVINTVYNYVISAQQGDFNITIKCTLNHYNSSAVLQSSIEDVIVYAEGSYVKEVSGTSSLDSAGLTMQSGDYLTFEFSISSNLIFGDLLDINDSYSIFFRETTPGLGSTNSYAVLPYHAFQNALGIMGCGTTLGSSILLSGGSMYGDMVMNGFMIRNYPNPKLNIKFRDLFKSFDAVGNIGLWYDRVNSCFVIEDKAYFYDSTTILELGEVTNFKRKPLNEAYYSKIAAGYDNDGNYERVQGASEFAVKREYSTAVKIKETKEIQAKYRYDSVGIEDIRNKQYMTRANEDDNADNDIFIVRSEFIGGKFVPITPSEVEFPLDAKGHDVFASYYNLMLTPRQNAVRWGNVLRACHYLNTNPFRAQKTTKLFELEMGSEYVDENSDIALSELADALFIPELYLFDYYINASMIAAINANPNGTITFISDGITYAGFIDKIETKSYNKKASFQLIAAEIPLFNFIFEGNIDASYIFEENVNANKTFE